MGKTSVIFSVVTLLIGVALGGFVLPRGAAGSSQFELEKQELNGRIASLQDALDSKDEQTVNTPIQRLLDVNAEIAIPLQTGLYKGEEVLYITTEVSDQAVADSISKQTGFPVTFAPAIRNVPQSSVANFFVFTNGISGDGIHGFQSEVFDSIPGDIIYSPAWRITNVEWVAVEDATLLRSVEEITVAKEAGRIRLTGTEIIANCPFIRWPGGELPTFQGVHDDNSVYGQAQILSMDTDRMEVVFRAHRGWAQDGSQIAYIVTDAALAGPAEKMGVVHAEVTQSILDSQGASDLYQFTNGILGSGPMGFQAGIGASKPGDQDYSPFWAINAITWNESIEPVLLESQLDIDRALDRGLITIEPMMGGMIVNCPFVPIGLLE
ncbi:MAG: hypothetical protein V3U49_06155 [Nitrososphaerales archaeon]